jgi:diguanylate cyclase (GGDEF)-like protein
VPRSPKRIAVEPALVLEPGESAPRDSETLVKGARTDLELAQRSAELTIEQNDKTRDEALGELTRSNAELAERLTALTVEHDNAARERAARELARTDLAAAQSHLQAGKLATRNDELESSRYLRARQHARRLEALWTIANDPTLRGQDFVFAVLQEAAAAMRPPLRFRGLLGRIEKGEVVVAGVSDDPDADSPRAWALPLGARVPLEDTTISRVTRNQGWTDLASVANLPKTVIHMGWRAVITTRFEAGGAQYALTFASTEAAASPFTEEDFAYLDVLAAAVAHELQINTLEDFLRDEEERSRQHAQRLEALWKIVNDSHLHDGEKWLAMLAQAAASISPGQGYRGMLWRVHGSHMTMEAAAEAPHNLLMGPPLRAGAVVSLAGTIVGKVLAAGGGTRSWDDIGSGVDATDRNRRDHARSFVATTFPAGGTTWALTFASGSMTRRPLGPLEQAYIEVLASFFSSNVQQRWQFERIEYQESHDELTGLLNRSQFRSRASAAARTSRGYAIIVIDVNAFHEINASYGHTTGDALLVEVAKALQQCAAEDEIVACLGGDVFAVYLPAPASDDSLHARVRDYSDVFTRSFPTGGLEKKFIARSASLGVALAPKDGETVDTVMSHADAALGAAKERGQGFTVFYEVGMERDAPRRAALRNELTEALTNGQFTLFYQPHVELSTGNVTGCEALIRWNHPDRGVILPSEFIPFAEQTGIITAIDAWVMRHAFAAAAELGALRPGFRLYFNLSGRQAGDPKLVRSFINAARIGVPLENIGVEITETDAMRDVEATRRAFRALRRLGVRTAIDDFGTGYSSLSSLKRLPLDILKIDRSFVAGVTSDTHDAAIAETIISMAARFDFESLAEGAENPQQLVWLRRHGCRYVQGFAICKPMPMEQFKVWLDDRDTGSGSETGSKVASGSPSVE